MIHKLHSLLPQDFREICTTLATGYGMKIAFGMSSVPVALQMSVPMVLVSRVHECFSKSILKELYREIPLKKSRTYKILAVDFLIWMAVSGVLGMMLSFTLFQSLAISSVGSITYLITKGILQKDQCHLEMPEGKITKGYGEYVIFHHLANGEKRKLSRVTFEQTYKILNEYSPAAIVNRGSQSILDECENRYEIIKQKVKEIDPTLEVVFIPRTLYELVLIKKCIQEDLTHKEICSNLSPAAHIQKGESLYPKATKPKCWHRCYFTDADNKNEHPGVKDVAYRLNRAIIKEFSPQAGGFTFKEFAALAEKEISFLKSHRQNSLEEIKKIERGEKVDPLIKDRELGPTYYFGYTVRRNSSMVISNETDAQILRNAVAIDCSKIAQKSFVLYRGANFQDDTPYSLNNKNIPYSLSYGTGLLAGSSFDPTATPLPYMKKEKNAYAIHVPYDQLHTSPFYIPSANAVAQIFGDGEIFHGRTKAWKNTDLNKIEGINHGANSDQRDHLKSNLTRDEFMTQFWRYKNQAIQLK